jgi:predicted  nucleic acid-binding Zn-ribbon protein
VRRQLGQAERDLEAATERLERLSTRMGSAGDHRELARLGEELAAAQAAVAGAEEAWLALAGEAEALGLGS